MNRLMLALSASAAMAVTAPAYASETISVPFTVPDGGVTTGLYSGTVSVTVSGEGFSLGDRFNDAFYLYNPVEHDASYYQLTFGTSPLVGFNPAQNAVNFIVGGLPAYSPDHVYTFLLNTGAVSPTQLHFGVGDGNFSDNGGSFRVTISAVPEPASWAMMIAGFGLAGAAMRRKRTATAAIA